MPEQNQPIQGNFGDIYRVETPHLDQALQQIQQNYTARNAYLQKENQNTEELLNKEMANVRSVDTPQIIDAYNDYKNSKQNQLFNRSIQTNPKAYAVAQMDANSKYANLMTMINKSSQYNAFGKQIAANRLQKPDNYSDSTGGLLSTFYNTPMDQLTQASVNGKPTDLTNVDNFRYQGGNANLAKAYQDAAGKNLVHYDDGTTDATGVQTTQHGWQYGNTPLQFRNTALSGLAGNEASRQAKYDWGQHNQQELDALDAQYQNSPNWQKLNIPMQQLPPYNPGDPVGNEATYQAKKYMVALNPTEAAAKVTQNRGVLAQEQGKIRLNGQEVMENIKEGNRETLAGMKHNWKTLDTAAQSQVLDDTVDAMTKDALNSGTYTYKSTDGQVSKLYDIKAGPELKLAMPTVDAKGHKYPADAVRYNPSNNTVIPLYYKRDDQGNIINANGGIPVTSDSKPMTYQEFKALVGKTYFGTREAAKESGTPGTKTTTSSIESLRSKYSY